MPSGSSDLKSLHAQFDKQGMLQLAESIASHLRDAWRIGGEFASRLKPGDIGEVDRVVVCGMGGSAIGADLARAVAGSTLAVPIYVSRDYEVDRCLARRSLAIISSYSGNTSETLSAFRSLCEKGIRMIAITSGGELSKLCKAHGVPLCTIPGGMPPRAAIAYSLIPMLRMLDAVGILSFTAGEFDEGEQAAAEICRRYSLDGGGDASLELARLLEGKLPFIYSCDGLLGAVSRRWACQFNENGKVLAHFAIFPELCHNEIVGWEVLSEVMSRAAIIVLEDKDDHPISKKQMEAALELMEPFACHLVRYKSEGEGRLARMLSLMLLGDFASVYLALLHGVDPTPVEKITILKERLARASR